MTSHPSLRFPALLAAAILAPVSLLAQDAPPLDQNQLLQLFKQVKEAQIQQSKSVRQRALQEAQAAAQNPSRAAEVWENAIQATRFDGQSREGTNFREWKDKEGAALRDKEIQSALRLHFNWLALTIQKLNGATNKELMPAVIQHTKESTAHNLMIEAYEENVKREKELAASGKHGDRNRAQKMNDDSVRQLNKQLMQDSVSTSIVARWLKLDENINDVAPRRGQNRGGAEWEPSAGNVDGIFASIVLPELREQKDPRVLEYWDMRLKRAAETVTKSKLTYEIDRFNTVNRPKILWDRAQDMKVVGQRNRAIQEMINLIKTYPTHPDASGWISAVEQELMPAPAAPPAGTAESTAPAPAATPTAAAVRTP